MSDFLATCCFYTASIVLSFERPTVVAEARTFVVHRVCSNDSSDNLVAPTSCEHPSSSCLTDCRCSYSKNDRSGVCAYSSFVHDTRNRPDNPSSWDFPGKLDRVVVKELFLFPVATTVGTAGCVRHKFGAVGSLRLVLPETLVPLFDRVSGRRLVTSRKRPLLRRAG